MYISQGGRVGTESKPCFFRIYRATKGGRLPLGDSWMRVSADHYKTSSEFTQSKKEEFAYGRQFDARFSADHYKT